MKEMFKKQKRKMAAFLALCLLFTSVESTAWAAEAIGDVPQEEESVVRFSGEDLLSAAQEAVLSGYGNTDLAVTPESMGYVTDLNSEKSGSALEKYEKLFNPTEDGQLYEFYPEYEGILPDNGDIRLFIRVNEEENHSLTGREQVIFLFSNSGEDTVKFRVWVDDNVLPSVKVKGRMDEALDMEKIVPSEEEILPSGNETLPSEDAASPSVDETQPSEDATSPSEDATSPSEDATSPSQDETLPHVVETQPSEKGMLSDQDGILQSEKKMPALKDKETAKEGNSAEDTPAGFSTNKNEALRALSQKDAGRELTISSHYAPIVASSGEAFDGKEIVGAEAETDETKTAVNSRIEGRLLEESAWIDGESLEIRAFVTTIGDLTAKFNTGNSVLTVHHTYKAESGTFRVEDQEITGLHAGETVEGADFAVDNSFYPLEKSEPGQLYLEEGNNEITLYYGVDLDAVSAARPGIWNLSGRKLRMAGSNLKPGEVAAHKTANWTNEDTQEAQIVLGAEGEPVKDPVDLVIVLDASGSMFYDQKYGQTPIIVDGKMTTRLALAGEAAKSLAKAVMSDNSGEKGKDSRVALVQFGGKSDAEPLQVVDLQTEWGELETSLDSYVNNPIDYGTCYSKALNKTGEILEKARQEYPDRRRCVVFLSDGIPNDFEDPGLWDYLLSHGYSWGKEEADGIKSQGADLYTVGVFLDQEFRTTFLKDMGRQPDGRDLYYDVKSAADMKAVFNSISSQVRPAGHDAVITDVINDQYFQVVKNQDGTWKLPKNVTYDEATHVITWNVGTIGEIPQTVTIPIKAVKNLTDGSYHTNKDVQLSYYDVDGREAAKTKDQIGDPILNVGGGAVTINYYLVNEEGKYVNDQGEELLDSQSNYRVKVFEEKFKDGDSELLTLNQTYEVTPQESVTGGDGRAYQAYENRSYSVTPVRGNANIIVECKVYAVKNKELLTVELSDWMLTKMYDGMPLILNPEDIRISGLPQDYSAAITAYSPLFITEVSEKTFNLSDLSIRIYDGAKTEVTENYMIGDFTGKLSVTPRPVTLTAGSASMVHNGTALVNDSYELTSGSLAPSQSLKSIVIKGSQTAVGTSANQISSAIIFSEGEDVTKNYELHYIDGTLTVTASQPGEENGGGNNGNTGGGGSSERPGGDSGYVDQGPGAQGEAVTVNPGEVPLAALPPLPSDGRLLIVDDGEVPLASLPKTGDRVGSSQLAVLISGILFGLYTTLKKKRENV